MTDQCAGKTTVAMRTRDSDDAVVEEKLRDAGLRATRQRMALGRLLFCGPNHHISADELHKKALAARHHLTLATVYNTLNQFCEAGLLRQVMASGSATYFDTDTSDHHHYFVENEGKVMDVPAGSVRFGLIPEPPEGMTVTHVDVIVHLRRKTATTDDMS